jgi:hypothetical protein
VAGTRKYSDEPSGSGATELVRSFCSIKRPKNNEATFLPNLFMKNMTVLIKFRSAALK